MRKAPSIVSSLADVVVNSVSGKVHSYTVVEDQEVVFIHCDHNCLFVVTIILMVMIGQYF